MSIRSSLRRPHVPVLVMVVTALLAAALSTTGAQETSTIRIVAGDTLEVATDTASPKSQFSWILTKDRKFLNAQRTKFFQTRFSEAGTYVLDVSVQDPVTSENGYRAFTIIVTDVVPGSAPAFPVRDPAQPLQATLESDPPVILGSTYLSPEGGIVKIDGSKSQGNISTFKIDLDTSVDSDGDGDPGNDFDNRATLSEKFGSPLYVFMLPKGASRIVRLTVTDLNAVSPSTTELPILFAPAPALPSSSASASVPAPGGHVTVMRNGLEMKFLASVDQGITAGREVLYEWDFGDRSKSLLNSPVHRYARSGTYTVGLTVKDIRTGEILHSSIDTLVIDPSSDVPPITSESSSSVAASSSSSSAASPQKSGFSFRGIFQVILIIFFLLALAIALYALFTWIKRKTTTSLQKTLEKMEGNIVKKPEEPKAPEPMKLKKEAPKQVVTPPAELAERETAKKEFASQTRSNETPVASSGPVPSWLSNAGKSAPAVAAAIAATPPAPAPSPRPATFPPAAPKGPTDTTGPTPAWLKPAPAPTNPPPAAPPKAPVPSAPVAPTTPPPAAAVAAPAPASALPPPPKPTPPAAPPKPAPTSATLQAPAPEKKPEAKKPEQKKTEPKKPDDEDPPIAIIQADSISK